MASQPLCHVRCGGRRQRLTSQGIERQSQWRFPRYHLERHSRRYPFHGLAGMSRLIPETTNREFKAITEDHWEDEPYAGVYH